MIKRYLDSTDDSAPLVAKIIELLDSATNEELADALFSLTCNHMLDNYKVIE